MKLKHAILETVSRDVLKQICADLEVTNVDQRSVNDMVAKLSRARRATPEKLLEYLSEAEVKQAAEKAGASSTGRRSMLIAALLEREDKGEGESMKPSDGDAPAPTERTHSGNGSPKRSSAPEQTEQYRHANEAVQRPDIGVQDQFQAKRPPKTYRYDSSLDPALSWDEQRERDLGEWLLGLIEQAAREGEKLVFAEAQEWKGGGVRVTSTSDAVRLFRDISKPFLNWAGKAERHQISVPSVPLFVHERHSTKAILDGIRHRKAKGLSLDLFGDPNMDIRDQLEAYEHKGPWQNRMILGDSLQVMNSILEYEGLGGQVQTIYMDPPYGVRFGSNFQPFVRKRDVKDGADSDLTREPEMVKAYRDTWELGLHSYLTYLRDRLALSRELLHESGSIFVQISDANLHRVREVLDDIFGSENYCGIIGFQKTGGAASSLLPTTVDYLLWYCKSRASVKYNQLYEVREAGDPSLDRYDMIELPNGESRRLIPDELSGKVELPIGKRFQLTSLVSDGESGSDQQFHFRGKKYFPKAGSHWKTSVEGLNQLAQRHRIEQTGAGLRYRRYLEDFPVVPMTDRWESTQLGTRLMYVVQTAPTVVARCVMPDACGVVHAAGV